MQRTGQECRKRALSLHHARRSNLSEYRRKKACLKNKRFSVLVGRPRRGELLPPRRGSSCVKRCIISGREDMAHVRPSRRSRSVFPKPDVPGSPFRLGEEKSLWEKPLIVPPKNARVRFHPSFAANPTGAPLLGRSLGRPVGSPREEGPWRAVARQKRRSAPKDGRSFEQPREKPRVHGERRPDFAARHLLKKS